jgi:hypothetical protein
MPMTTPDTPGTRRSNRGLWLLLAPLVLIGAGLTISEYLRVRQAAPPPVTAPAPEPPKPKPVVAKPIPLAESITERIDLLVYDALVPPIPKTEQEVIAALGAPARTSARSIPNQYEPAKPDTLRTLVYPGMTVDFLKVTHTGGEFPTGITVTGPKVWVKWDLNVGTSEKKVIDTLGQPRTRTAASLTYEYSVAPSTVTFHLQNGVVTKIVWSYYVD